MDDNLPLGECLFVFLAIVIAVAGLAMISAAGGWYWPGIIIFLLAVVAGMYSIKRYYDRWEVLRRQH